MHNRARERRRLDTQSATTCTTLNATQSPLLQLPPELRNNIWDYAYGNQFVRLELLEGNTKYKFGYQACIRGSSPRFCDCHNGSPERPILLLPLVGKHFWWEVSPVFWATVMPVFTEEGALRTLLLSSHQNVAQIRHLETKIVLGDWSESKAWRTALSSALVDKLKNLRGGHNGADRELV